MKAYLLICAVVMLPIAEARTVSAEASPATPPSPAHERSSDADAHMRLGIDFFLTHELEIAIDEFREAARLQPTNSDAQYNLGVALAKVGDLSGAIAAWTHAERLDPTAVPEHYSLSALVAYNYGIALYRQGRVGSAMAEWRAARGIQADFPEVAYAMGMGSLATDDAAQAVSWFHDAIVQRPRWSRAYDQLGVAYFALREFRLAEDAWRMAVQLSPGEARAQMHLGVVRLREGDPTRAVDRFRHAIELAPLLAEAHVNLGMAWSNRHRWRDAVDAFTEGVKLAPRWVEARVALGAALANWGRWPQAVSQWRRALALRHSPSVGARLQYNLGLGLSMMGHAQGAIAAFQRAVELKADWSLLRYRLGVAYAMDRQWVNAAEQLEQAVALEPLHAGARYSLGHAYYHLARIDEAIAAYRLAVELAPDFADAAYRLGVTLRTHGRAVEAIGPLENAARRGLVEAQSLVAAMYANGSGVAQNLPMAIQWWVRLAARPSDGQPVKEANAQLSRLRTYLWSGERSSALADDISEGFALARRVVWESSADGAMHSAGRGGQSKSGTSGRWVQSGLGGDDLSVLIRKAMALDQAAHASLEERYLRGSDDIVFSDRARIRDYLVQTAHEGSPSSCRFLRQLLSSPEDHDDRERVDAAERHCRGLVSHAH